MITPEPASRTHDLLVPHLPIPAHRNSCLACPSPFAPLGAESVNSKILRKPFAAAAANGFRRIFEFTDSAPNGANGDGQARQELRWAGIGRCGTSRSCVLEAGSGVIMRPSQYLLSAHGQATPFFRVRNHENSTGAADHGRAGGGALSGTQQRACFR